MFVSSANGHKCCNIATVYKISHFIVQCFTSPKKRGTSRKYILFLSFYAFCIIYTTQCQNFDFKGPSTLATLFNHMWPRIVAGIFIPVGNHYFQALASTLQFVAQVCDRLWLVPATDRAFAYITYMSQPHVALLCSGPPQCAAKCGWTKWPMCSGPKLRKDHRKISYGQRAYESVDDTRLA